MEKQILEKLYAQYSREIFLYLCAMLKNTAAAEDILQDTFLKALLSLNHTHPNVRAWLYMVAKNECVNYLKRQKRFTPFDEASAALSSRADPLEALLEKEDQRLLFNAMMRLDDSAREILYMQYFQNLPQKEICQILNLTNGSLRVMVHRAKKKLKQFMEVENHDI